MKRLLAFVILTMALAAAPAAAQRRDCDAQPARKCNPQQECLAKIERMKGPARDAAQRDCERMPTSGTCFDPDAQANCREPDRRNDRDRRKK